MIQFFQKHVLPDVSEVNDGDGDDNMMENTYRGVGGVYSPEQNAL